MAEVTLEQVQAALDDLDYPASKEEIVRHAEHKGAEEAVLKALRALPLADYASREELARSVGTVDARRQDPSEKAVRARDTAHQQVAEHLRQGPTSP